MIVDDVVTERFWTGDILGVGEISLSPLVRVHTNSLTMKCETSEPMYKASPGVLRGSGVSSLSCLIV